MLTLQLLYIFRINWEEEASKVKLTFIRNAIMFSFTNAFCLLFDQPKAHGLSKKTNDLEVTTASEFPSDRAPTPRSSLKFQIFKRLVVFILLFGLFLTSSLDYFLEFKSSDDSHIVSNSTIN